MNQMENLNAQHFDRFYPYEAPAPAMEMVRGLPHLAQNLVDLRQVSSDQPLLKVNLDFLFVSKFKI